MRGAPHAVLILMPLLLATACQQEGVEAQSFELPGAEEGTIFAVADLGTDADLDPRDRFGRIGDVDALGGPHLDVEAVDLYVLEFGRGSFNGVRGPELLYLDAANPRDGMDTVRLPDDARIYRVEAGALESLPAPPARAADLRVPCDSARAATRPSVEVDPEARCPTGGAPVVITCAELSQSRTDRRILGVDDREIEVELAQEGCRVEMTCAASDDCLPLLPLHAVLPPSGSATGDAALLEWIGASDRCARTGNDPLTFACGAGTTFTLR